MAVDQDLSPPAFRELYTVAGRFLLTETRDTELAVLVSKSFDGWLLDKVPLPTKQSVITVTFDPIESMPEIPLGFDAFSVADGTCYTNNDVCFLDLESARIKVTRQNAIKVMVWVKDRATLGQAMSFAVCAGLRRAGVFELHSAGVFNPKLDAGALIVGPSGSGKSTLTLQLLASGWQCLSDDTVLLNLIEENVVARGFRRFFAVSEYAAAAANLESAHGDVQSALAKRRLEPETIFPTALVSHYSPRTLFFVSVNGSHQSQLTELAEAETMKRLIRCCPWATYDRPIARANLEALSRLARQSRAFDLSAGFDLVATNNASALLGTYMAT